MPIPFRLDYVIEKLLVETASAEQKVLLALAGVKLSHREARALWTRVLEHKWYLSERLGRDVGVRVAAIDYFENFYTSHTEKSKNPSISGLMRRLMRPLVIHKIA